MNRTVGKAGVLGVILILMLGISDIASAGYGFNYSGVCGVYGPGEQYCYGKLVDIASETQDSNRYAWFSKSYFYGVSSLWFHMEYNNVSYDCSAPESMHDLWNSFMSNKVTFFVVIDTATGTCTSGYAGPDSSNPN
ncbi:MAG TPA: hypothetical protein VG962_06115 [Steroidobacteraceae bacterium]|nr:hypothetical protein [Steroidobacteraceae bacterium]